MSVIQFIKSKSFLKQLIIAFIAFLVFSVLVVQWLKFSTNHNQKIEVPNLEKMSINNVETVLDNIDLNFNKIIQLCTSGKIKESLLCRYSQFRHGRK